MSDISVDDKFVTIEAQIYESMQTELATLKAQVAKSSKTSQLAQQRALLDVVTKIRESLDLDVIFKSTAIEVRQLLSADRVGMFQFTPDQNYQCGEFVSEDTLPEFNSTFAAKVNDHCFGENHAKYYEQGRIWACSDIYAVNLSECHLQILARFQVIANLVVPLLKGSKLWGLLCIHQCSSIREWQEEEIEFVKKIAIHLGVALQQAELLEQAQRHSIELRSTLADLNAIVDNLADGLLVTNPLGQITRYNPALLEMLNLKPDDLYSHRLEEIFSKELIDLVKQTCDREMITVEIRLVNNRAGQAIATSIFREAEVNASVQCLGSVILIRDVTMEREVDRMKTDFLSTVSHELRTPLTSVLGFATIIQQKLDEDIFPLMQGQDQKILKALEKVNSNVNIIVSESERLTCLINDVLDIAKMEAGQVEWNYQRHNLVHVLERAIAATSPLLEAKGLQLVCDFQATLPEVTVDGDRIIQVVINIISNAVKFAKQGSITCHANLVDQDIVIGISDKGVGIALEDQSQVFEKFKQVGDIFTDKPKGTGLGLPICKQIVEHHSGKIWVESQLGKGSTFFFTIPLDSAV
jgi:PAS domain S-box-containing protein